LALEKLTEAPKATDISDAENNIVKSYSDTYNSVSGTYLDLPTIMTGMNDLLYSQSGFLSDQKESFLTATARSNRDAAGVAFDKANAEYNADLVEYKGTTRGSATSSLDRLFSDTYAMTSDVADAVAKAQGAIAFISANQPDYDTKSTGDAATSVNGWATTINSDVSSIVSGQNSIGTNQNALTNLINGADAIDIQTAQLNLEQAQRTYDEYFIRAPYDGTVGRIPVNVFGQAGGSTVIATIIGAQKIAVISLNEVDAASVQVGQPVLITFDAINGLDATGTVEQVDQVGTVSQGVVSYSVKILINTNDSRIKPGMSVNVTIVTKQEDNVLLVPSSAVKTQGPVKYVQVLDQATVMNALNSLRASNASTASSTARRLGGGAGTTEYASTSGQYGSSTRQFGIANGGAGAPTLTIPSDIAPTQVIVTTGDSDTTNTVITGGLNRGQFVVTRTITSSAGSQAAAPSILSSFGARGGARPGGGPGAAGAVRIGG
ncbi:MAG: HlyD family efflux transporter periplasmic adaptor subunit, partial [Patescibacteria group bacterium]|nr:HlyD family efflux transporter periplasmic adaptor subunit [Patescibacteria group bacterium]